MEPQEDYGSEFYIKKILPYTGVATLYQKGKGYVCWRRGTGLNIEILHLRVFKKRRGYATQLIRDMTECLAREMRPYHSVFVFCLANNAPAIAAYESFGFKMTKIDGLYKHDHAMIGWVKFEDLCEKMGV